MVDFSGLGAALKSMYTTVTGAKTSPDHAAIAMAISNVHQAANNMGEFAGDLHDMGLRYPMDRLMDASFRMAAESIAKKTKVETKEIWSMFKSVFDLIKADADQLDRNFSQLFRGLKTVDDVKVTHAYIFGYMEMATQVTDYFGFLMAMIHKDKGERLPAYIETIVKHDLDQAVAFCNMLRTVRNSGKKTIMDDITHIVNGGANLFVFSEGKTLDEFAQAADYLPQVSEAIVHGLSLNPAMWVINVLLHIQRWRYERNVKMHEWAVTKIAILQMELAGQTDSAEYQRKREVLEGYTKIIAALDKKIKAYENA